MHQHQLTGGTTSGSEELLNHDQSQPGAAKRPSQSEPSLQQNQQQGQPEPEEGHGHAQQQQELKPRPQSDESFNYTYYKLSYDTSQQRLMRLSQNANDNDIDNVSHDSYHLREESADELEASGDELDRSTGDELDRSTGDELDRSTGDELNRSRSAAGVYDLVKAEDHVMSADEAEPIEDEDDTGGVSGEDRKVFDTVLHIDEEKLMQKVREEMRREEEEWEREGRGEGEEETQVRQGDDSVDAGRAPGLQETSIDDVMSPLDKTAAAAVDADVILQRNVTEDVTSQRDDVTQGETQGRKVQVEIVEKEQEKVYNRTPSVEKPLPYNFSRSESEGNESTANERVNGNVPSDVTPPVVANGNGNEIPYVLHRRHIEKQQTFPLLQQQQQQEKQQANGRVSRPLQKQLTEPANQKRAKDGGLRQQKVSRDQARLQLEQIKTDLRTPIVPPSKRSPRDKSPGSGLVRVNKLPPRDSYSCKDDTVSPSSEKEIISQIALQARYDRSPSAEDRDRKPQPVVPQVQKGEPVQDKGQVVQQQVQKVQPAATTAPTVSKKPPPPAQKPPTAAKPAQKVMMTSQEQATSSEESLTSSSVTTHRAYPPQNDLNKPSPPKKPPRTSSNVESEQETKLKLMGLQKQNLAPPKAPKAEMEDLTPTTDTDSDSSGGTGKKKPAPPIRGLVTSATQRAEEAVSGGRAPGESASLVLSQTGSIGSGSHSSDKKIDSPVCEESFSAMKGQDLPFADSVPHFSDEDDEDTGKKPGDSEGSEEMDLDEQLNVPGLEQEEFSDQETPGGSPRSPGRRVRVQEPLPEDDEDLPPPVPTCPPPDSSDVSSDSEPEIPTDEALPDILSVPGVTNLPPPAPSFELMEEEEEEENEEQPGTTGTQSDDQGQPGTIGTQSKFSPVEPRRITAIPEEPVEHNGSPSQVPPVTQFKYVRSDSDIPPPPPPVELLQATAMHDISSEEEVELPEGDAADLPDLETQLVAGQVSLPPPVAPTELSSGSDVSDGIGVEDDDSADVDLDVALASSTRIVGQIFAAEYSTAQGKEFSPTETDAAHQQQGAPLHDISSEEEVMLPDEEAHEIHGDLQEALREGRVMLPPALGDAQGAMMDISSGSDDDGGPEESLLPPEMDQFEKRFEMHIKEDGDGDDDDECVTCLPEGAEHLITPLEEGAESLSRTSGSLDRTSAFGSGNGTGTSGMVPGRRPSGGSSSGESGAVLGGTTGTPGGPSTAGLPLQISSESDEENPPADEDLPDPTDILEADVLTNPYMVPGDEFSEHIHELPSPPHPAAEVPGRGLNRPPQVQETIAHHTSIIDQYYGTGSMQTSGPQGSRPGRSGPPIVPPKPPTRSSSARSHPPPTGSTRSAQAPVEDDSDSSSPEHVAVSDNREHEEADQLEALESLRQPYIVHHSDSSDDADDGNRRSKPETETESSSDSESEDDFEEIPEAIIRQRQLGRHHVEIEVTNRRYRNQVTMEINNTAGVASGSCSAQQQHIYQNVNVGREGGSGSQGQGVGSSDSGHIYQNLSVVSPTGRSGGVAAGQGGEESAYQPLRPRPTGQAEGDGRSIEGGRSGQSSRSPQEQSRGHPQQNGRSSQDGRSQQGEVFSNPYAESFGAERSSTGQPLTPQQQQAATGQRSTSAARSAGRASQSDSSE